LINGESTDALTNQEIIKQIIFALNRAEREKMINEAYYEQLIEESYAHIRKFENQIQGLMDFRKENDKGAEEFSAKIGQRRRNISSFLDASLKHPMVRKLNTRLSNAIDISYENNVLNNFQAVKDDILRAIRKLEYQIEDEKDNISLYQRRIREIEEEERRAAEAARKVAEQKL